MPDRKKETPLKDEDILTLIVAILAMLCAGWSAWEAHLARIEAREAIEAAQRGASAAENENKLAARSQSSYLVPSIQKGNGTALLKVKNVSTNVALNIRAGYFLYTGPLKSVNDVQNRLAHLPLRSVVTALGGSDTADAFNTPISTGDAVNTEVQIRVVAPEQTLTTDIPGITSAPGQPITIGMVKTTIIVTPKISERVQVSVPSKLLVIGLVSSEDTANGRHSATFCFPVANIDDEECAKLNTLQLADPK